MPLVELSGSDPLVFFGAFAALIFVGYLGNVVFDKLKFNDTVLLIALGLLVGPIMEYVSADDVEGARVIIGTLALILILFNGGLGLKIHDLLHGVGGASILAFSGFALTVGGVAGVAYYLIPELSFSGALALGAILGGTSALVVMPSLAQMRTEKRTATMLSLESAITDILVVITTFTLLSIIVGGEGPDAGGIGAGVITLFAMSLFLGSLAGFLWLWLVPFVREKEFGYMMTLGAAFAVYVFTEWTLGNVGVSEGGGPLSVLAFGIVLGNSTDMGKKLRARVGDAFGKGLARFQGELGFLVRTFFFVYLGILVDLDLLLQLRILGMGSLVFAAMLAARYISVALTVQRLKFTGDDWVLWVMMPRGLAAAVMAALPFEMGVPGSESFVAIAFLILILSNLMATVGGMVLGKKTTPSGPRRPPGEKAAARRTTTDRGQVLFESKPVKRAKTHRPPTPPMPRGTPRKQPVARATSGPPAGGFKFPPPPVPLSDEPPTPSGKGKPSFVWD